MRRNWKLHTEIVRLSSRTSEPPFMYTEIHKPMDEAMREQISDLVDRFYGGRDVVELLKLYNGVHWGKWMEDDEVKKLLG